MATFGTTSYTNSFSLFTILSETLSISNGKKVGKLLFNFVSARPYMVLGW